MQYLIVDIFPFAHQVHLLTIDGKEIIINQNRNFFDFSQLKKFLKEYQFKKENIILNLNSEDCLTDYLFLPHTRTNPHQPITESEIDSTMTGVVSLLLNEKSNLGYSLSQIFCHHLVIEGHTATNPLGLSGKQVQSYFNCSYVKNTLLNELKAVLPLNKISLIGEAGSFWTHVFASANLHQKTDQPFLFLVIFYDSASLYRHSAKKINLITTISWGEKNLISNLFGYLGVSAPTARKIIKLHRENKLSPDILKKIAAFLDEEFQQLSRSINSIINKQNVSYLYLLPNFNLPEPSLKFDKRLKIQVVNIRGIGEKLGYNLKYQEEAPASMLSLFELNLTPIDNLANKIASRRLRWHEYNTKPTK